VVGIDSPDISGTEIRRRVVAGEPLDGMVSPAVATIIEERGLYR
jgi:nicotinic acid mononucleotide adenylyltransferase